MCRRHQPRPARDVLAIETGQIEGCAIAGAGFARWPALGMDRAHAGLGARWQRHHGVADSDAAGDDAAGCHGAGAGHGEGAIHGHAEGAVAGAAGVVCCGRCEAGLERLDALAGGGGDRKDLGAFQRRVGECCGKLRLDLVAPGLIDEIDLVQGNDAVGETQQVEDREVLAGLRHDAVVGGDDEHDEIDRGRACQHGVDEAFVTGHVDETERAAVRASPCRRSPARW